MAPPAHVVLVTYGEPPAPSFAAQLTYSWRILLNLTRTVARIPKPLLPIIAVARARGRRRAWLDEGYASPLEPITARQAALLAEAIAARNGTRRWTVHVAYEFRDPLLAELLETIPDGHPVFVVPMYATDSAFTHGLSKDVAAACTARRPAGPRIDVMPALDPDTLADLAAAHVREGVKGRSGASGPDVALVLAAHGTVLEPPRPIDTGLEATQRLCDAIRVRLAPEFGLIVNGWLNHTRGGRWTEPPIEEALRQVAEAGFTRVVYFPYGFLADNAESQLEGRIALRGQPSLRALHLPCFNDSPALAAALADQVLARASEGLPRTETPHEG
jgi:protoheme ferro-lyase